MKNIPDYFGCLVFNDHVMKEYLSDDVYSSLKKTIEEDAKLDLSCANAVAQAMRDWALANGCTHYTHWFQPLTGITAEKHDSFITPGPEGRVLMEFSGKELVRGESDASSFPSGGIRSTFEARGYTAWDPTSYAFIKGNTLCIPTAFCSFTGEALDKKTPLLRSMQALNKQALRILKLFGHDNVKVVKTSVGPEQEYFLVDREMFDQRKDLVFTGRTLFGAMPPKGQEMDDHYFGVIKPRVQAFMTELDEELWKLGIFAKTEHNEVAPAQHELAPIYSTTNIAADHNQLTMEMMQKIAAKHGLVCLLHEKPFQGVSGSGKHNNWSLSTDTGINLLSPGETPYDNAQFLLFLCAVIQAVDDYQDLLRISVASAGNDHRLGASEAPPAIISIFLGDELEGILKAIEEDVPYEGAEKKTMKLGVSVLPRFSRDTTDRNRTSPFAFTGNKFEFRSLGSANSISCCNIMLNTAVAESLCQYADELEGKENFSEALHELIRRVIKNHKRILFSGNGYEEEWTREATEVRGLLNYKTTPDCVPHLLDEKNVALLAKHKVYRLSEVKARTEITLDNYCKTVMIEARTMVDMASREILPAVEGYCASLAKNLNAKKQADPDLKCSYEQKTVHALSELTDRIAECTAALEEIIGNVSCVKDVTEKSCRIRDEILPAMKELRAAADKAETMTSDLYWPFPTYSDLMFGVR